MLATAEQRDQAVIERKRRIEEERKTRIFDPKSRTKQVDKGAISAQIREKEEAAMREKQRELASDEQTSVALQQIEELMAVREQQKREITAQIQKWNRDNSSQKSPKRNVNDPIPEQTSSPSSLTTFQGEDPHAKERQKRQAQQLRDWANQQMAEKERKRQEENEKEKQFETSVGKMDQYISQLEAEHQNYKIQQNQQDLDLNKMLMEAKREKEIQDKLSETFKNLQEMKKLQTQSMLVETTEHAFSSPSGRILRTEFKGMTQEQVKGIRDLQDKQKQEKEQLSQKQKEQEKRYEEMSQNQLKLINQRIADVEQQKRNIEKQIAEENRRLAQEAKERNARRNKEFTSNVPSPEYFNQFNTSTR